MRSGSCSRQQRPPSEPPRSVQHSIATALPIVLVLIILPSIAFASPPDPSWIAGFYDGADGDDVVSLVYETSAANTAASSHIGPLPCLTDMPLAGIVRIVAGRHFTGGPRAPPLLRSLEFVYVFSSLPPPGSPAKAIVTFPSIPAPKLSQHGDLAALHIEIDPQFWGPQAESEMRSLG